MKAIALFVLLFGFLSAPSLGAVGDDEEEYIKHIAEVNEILKIAWGENFSENLRQIAKVGKLHYISKESMKYIAKTAKFSHDTSGITIQDNIPQDGIWVVLEGVPAIFVAKTVNHEVGHIGNHELRKLKNGRFKDEAAARKRDEPFLTELFGQEWTKRTVKALLNHTIIQSQYGVEVQTTTDKSIAELFSRFQQGGLKLERNEWNTKIVERMVFNLTNSEKTIAEFLEAVASFENSN